MSDAINEGRRAFLGTTVMTVAGAQLGMFGALFQPLMAAADDATGGPELQSLRRATAWLNTPPLTVETLRGKVVLIDFCTYTCINWIRTLPHIRAFVDRYEEHGLAVISVHAPEFSFEHDLGNVRRAVQHLRVEHPVAVDNEYVIWRAFRNRYWPALYLLDAQGRIRHRQFGEGDYDQAETVIRRLLAEAGFDGVGDDPVPVEGRGVEIPADWDSLRSLETYLGYGRTGNFASPGGLRSDIRRVYTAPSRLIRNEWALSGDWTAEREAAVLHRAGGRLLNCFHARDVHLVMGPAAGGAPIRFRVRIDGESPGAAHGLDVDENGFGSAADQRMYQLIRQTGPIADRQFEIEFLDPGVEAFAFTFG